MGIEMLRKREENSNGETLDRFKIKPIIRAIVGIKRLILYIVLLIL
jgi:hypothetical protein